MVKSNSMAKITKSNSISSSSFCIEALLARSSHPKIKSTTTTEFNSDINGRNTSPSRDSPATSLLKFTGDETIIGSSRSISSPKIIDTAAAVINGFETGKNIETPWLHSTANPLTLSTLFAQQQQQQQHHHHHSSIYGSIYPSSSPSIMNAQDQASVHHHHHHHHNQNGSGEGSSATTTTTAAATAKTTTTTKTTTPQSISTTFPTLPFFTNASAFHSAFHQIATAASTGKSMAAAAAAAASIGDGQQVAAAAQAYEWLAKEMLCQNVTILRVE
ncbi:hypothetical protein DERF_000355 [Dermatophagoides farinae]|uniref:Uncharacterized protein n=1 Tax=Dermatophagoides farinae TaxID=6954 RepID=A0A922L876_DERFA|nr:hypothetical protein DERF_000355 [Dermatophagoides farinae]